MPYIEGNSRKQKTMLPDCIDDLITKDNPVRVIDAFIESLNISELGFIRSTPEDTGRPGYNPRTYLSCTYTDTSTVSVQAVN